MTMACFYPAACIAGMSRPVNGVVASVSDEPRSDAERTRERHPPSMLCFCMNAATMELPSGGFASTGSSWPLYKAFLLRNRERWPPEKRYSWGN